MTPRCLSRFFVDFSAKREDFVEESNYHRMQVVRKQRPLLSLPLYSRHSFIESLCLSGSLARSRTLFCDVTLCVRACVCVRERERERERERTQFEPLKLRNFDSRPFLGRRLHAKA